MTIHSLRPAAQQYYDLRMTLAALGMTFSLAWLKNVDRHPASPINCRENLILAPRSEESLQWQPRSFAALRMTSLGSG